MLGADVVLPEDERLCQAVGGWLLDVAERDPELGAVAQESLELLGVVRGGDDQDVADARQNQRGQRVVDHRLVVDRHELLRDAMGDGVQPGTGAAGQDDALHGAESTGPLPPRSGPGDG